jgi:hypothetical protein
MPGQITHEVAFRDGLVNALGCELFLECRLHLAHLRLVGTGINIFVINVLYNN